MNVEHEDEEFVDVKSRGSEHNKQSNDPPPEFTGTQAERVQVSSQEDETVATVHAHSSSVARTTCFEQADACDGLEPEDVATADGVNMILVLGQKLFRVNTDRNFLMLWRTHLLWTWQEEG